MVFTLNGMRTEVEDAFKDYRTLVAMAGLKPGATVTYRSPFGSGELLDGEDLLLDDKMVVNVADTSRA